MDITTATADFEAWLGRLVPLHAPDVAYKHDLMAEPFPFFRGTYYRWAQVWPAACPELADAPRVLAVGDLHLENFGTWRDPDGRLCWGVNDFDEVDELPYANDLVRLAASARFARKAGVLGVKPGAACRAILAGYRECLAAGGRPFVLEERHPALRAMAMSAEREPAKFWKKMVQLLRDPPADPPAEAREALRRDLPDGVPEPAVRFRPRVGVGSLGKPRYLALVEWAGGWVAREAKAVTPPATAWATGTSAGPRAAEAVVRAVRCSDPFYRPGPAWVARRLAPRCSRIELTHLAEADADRVLHAMGAEVANVHLGTPRSAVAIMADLARRPADWLEDAARSAAKAVERDWRAWAKAHGKAARRKVQHDG